MQVGPEDSNQGQPAEPSQNTHRLRKRDMLKQATLTGAKYISSGVFEGAKKGLNVVASYVGGIDQYIERYAGLGADAQTKQMLAVYMDFIANTQNLNSPESVAAFFKEKSGLLQNIKALCELSNQVSSEIAALKKQNVEKLYLSGEDKEKLERLELLRLQLNTDPAYIAEKMHQHGTHPVYVHMQPIKFLSILVKSNENLALAHPQTLLGIPEVERIALYGYSTKDYAYLNDAARKSEGQIQDDGTRAYFEHVVLAFQYLPKVPLPILNKQGLPVDLKRGIANPSSQQWVDETFVVGKEFIDYAFSSCTNDYAVQMMGTLIFKAPPGANEFPYARILAEPYTAQRGEAEILLEPGAPFVVSHVEKLPGGSFRVELLPIERVR